MTDIEIPLGKRSRKYRFFEQLPFVLSVSLLLLPVILSFFSPVLAAIFIITYIIVWFVKSIGMAFRTVQGYNTMLQAKRVNWRRRLAELESPGRFITQSRDKGWRHRTHIANLKLLSQQKDAPKPSQIYSAVIIAINNESRAVLQPTVEAVLHSDYDLKHLLLIVAYEERGGKVTEELARDIVKTYGSQCFYARAIRHRNNMPDEVRGKGGNIANAGHELQQILEQKGIRPNNVIVTTLDCDNQPHPTYFAYVTYEYVVNLERHNCSFQPIALYLNNIWDVPAPMRVLATGNSFWTITNSLRPHLLQNFASHSQPMSALMAVNFWSVRTVVEDGHQYWRSYFAFDGHYEVVPIYVPIYQDAVLGDTYRKTLKAQFFQVARWAYGASDIAYVVDKGFRKDRTVPLLDLTAKFLRLIDNHVSRASASLILAFGAWAPLFINPESSRSIVAHQLPNIASGLQQIATIGLFITIFLTFKMLPPRPMRYKRHRNIFMLIQWVLMPVTSICYGAASAFYAQARLFSGRYLDKFAVTDKAVKSD